MKPQNSAPKKLTVKVSTLKALTPEQMRKVQGGGLVGTMAISVRGCANTNK
jgi:hypothetical protein